MSKWPVKKLGEVCEIIMGQSPKGDTYNDKGEGMALINGPVEFGKGAFGKTVQTKFTTAPTKLCKKDDLILCVRGSTTGKMNIAGSDACIGRGVAAIRGKGSQDWVNHFINFKREDIYNLGSGSTFPNVSGATLKKVLIPVPPLAEQERIVAVLDQAFESIAAATAHTQQKLHNTQELFQSTLQSAFSRNDESETQNEEWVETTLEKVLEQQPRNGWSPPAAHHSDAGIPVLTLSSVTGFEFKPDKIKFTSAETDSSRHYWVHNGELLITRSNTPELVGHVAIAEGIETNTIYPDLIMRMVPNPAKAETKFLYYQLRTPELREIITGRASGANPTMKKISKANVQTLPISLPPLSTQRTIVAKLDALSAETRRLESLYQRQLHAYTELKQSLLDQAFSGKL